MDQRLDQVPKIRTLKTTSTISAYNKYHEVYDNETKEFWDKFPTTTIKAFTSKLPGKNILDLGSGPGRDALLLKEKGLNVTCLDASTEMVKRTNELGFHSICSDFRNMDFPNESFDGVWAYTSLLHIPKIESSKVVAKIHQILKPGGNFLVGMIEGSFEGQVKRETMPGTQRFFSFYGESELREVILKHGFKFEYQEKYTPHSKTYLSQIYSK